MSFVAKVTEEEAGPDLKPLFDQIRQHYGFVPNYYQALGRFPEAIQKERSYGEVVMRDGALPTALKEKILLVVSGINSSSYCIAAHMEVLNRLGVPATVGRYLATDYKRAPVSEKELAVFRFADKLTRQPDRIEKADAQAVLDSGWDENALVETVLVVAFCNYINRISFGLGLVGEHSEND
jgi:uncharacterized peroxidase-related enzyme